MSLMISGLRLNQVAVVFPAAFGSSTTFSALGSLVATKEIFDGADDSSESQSGSSGWQCSSFDFVRLAGQVGSWATPSFPSFRCLLYAARLATESRAVLATDAFNLMALLTKTGQ